MRFSLALVTAWMCLPLPASAEDEAAAADPAPIADEPLPATATVCVAAWGGGRTWVSPVAVDIDDAHIGTLDKGQRWCVRAIPGEYEVETEVEIEVRVVDDPTAQFSTYSLERRTLSGQHHIVLEPNATAYLRVRGGANGAVQVMLADRKAVARKTVDTPHRIVERRPLGTITPPAFLTKPPPDTGPGEEARTAAALLQGKRGQSEPPSEADLFATQRCLAAGVELATLLDAVRAAPEDESLADVLADLGCALPTSEWTEL